MTPRNSQPSFTALFEQLGLPSDPESIASFIKKHGLQDQKIAMHEASFWTPHQAALIRELLSDDADWAIVIDQLSLALNGAAAPSHTGSATPPAPANCEV